MDNTKKVFEDTLVHCLQKMIKGDEVHNDSFTEINFNTDELQESLNMAVQPHVREIMSASVTK